MDHYPRWMTYTKPKPKLASERDYPYMEMYNTDGHEPQIRRDDSLLQGKTHFLDGDSSLLNALPCKREKSHRVRDNWVIIQE